MNCIIAARALFIVNAADALVTLTLHCICSILLLCSHSPVPTITWRKINGNIPKKARLRKSQAVLEIPNIQLEDSGTYECKAENPRGGTAFKGHLQVYSESESTVTFHFFMNKKKSDLFSVCVWWCDMHAVWLAIQALVLLFPTGLFRSPIFCLCAAIMHYPRASIHYHKCGYIYTKNSSLWNCSTLSCYIVYPLRYSRLKHFTIPLKFVEQAKD